MTPVVDRPQQPPTSEMPWAKIAWFGALVAACYAPILYRLVKQWGADEDMGHGFFVPVIAAYIVWQKRDTLMALKSQPDWRGLALAIFGALQMIVGVLGADLFTARTAMVVTIVGCVWFLGGVP